MATPQVPPRPVRSQYQQPTTGINLGAPEVPLRPARRSDRSQSPHRGAFAPSPLNDTPFPLKHSNDSGGVYGSGGNDGSSSSLSLPPRPPSVTLPSIGQEGNEYADIEDHENEAVLQKMPPGSPTTTRRVSNDLPLHAPKPSLSKSDARARISTVTRTDSSQAAAAGIGRRSSLHADDHDSQSRPLKSKTSQGFRPPSSASTERPGSAQAEAEQGIPHIGQFVPMYPNAGDVQAPSPAPHPQAHPTGIGFHNDGSKPRHHGRTRSGREVFQPPPGSYGLHGHGMTSKDMFEKAWYDKHPEALVREEGQYSPALGGSRNEWVLSSDDLNKLVRDTATRGSGFGTMSHHGHGRAPANFGIGTAPTAVALPDEQIGYMASEEYAHRISSSRPVSSYQNKAHSNSSQTHIESPLRKASFPVDDVDKAILDKSETARGASEHPLEDEDDVIHINDPEYRTSKYTGNGYDPPTVDLGPHGGNTDAEGGYIEERGRDTPILASDEATPGAEYLQPAVPPAERPGSGYHDSDFGRFNRHGSRTGSANNSRPSSRPGSIHGTLPGLSRFTSHDEHELYTPLEDVEEYEPLFPEEEKSTMKPQTQADRVKHRPDMKRRFPSQDIWEDSPESARLETEVDSPEPGNQPTVDAAVRRSTAFETPEAEASRKGEVGELEKEKLLTREERLTKSNFKPHLRQEMKRPGIAQRFPSRDIWEDSPDSARLETTVGDEEEGDTGLVAGAVVHTSGRPDQDTTEQHREGATEGSSAIPAVPPRPAKTKHANGTSDIPVPHPPIPSRPMRSRVTSPHEPSHLSEVFTAGASDDNKEKSPVEPRKVPAIPDRPKPQVPTRPNKTSPRDSGERTNLSASSNPEQSPASSVIASPPPVTKAKPTIPARPAGSKIGALQAGFMSDLNNRLKLGPQAPPKVEESKVEEEEEEKAPLSDARKGRARGPARRKPGVSPSAVAEPAKAIAPQFSVVGPFTVWEIAADGALDVFHAHQNQHKPMPVETVKPTSQEATNAMSNSTSQHSGKASDTIHSPDTATEKTPPIPPTALEPNKTNIDAASEDITSSSSLPKADIPVKPDAIEEPSDTTDSGAQASENVFVADTMSQLPEKPTVVEGGDVRTGEAVDLSEGAEDAEEAWIGRS